jgi:hypothetical protein
MSKNDINGESMRQNTDANFNQNNANKIQKRPKIKIGKQSKKDFNKLKRVKNGENKNEFENAEDDKKNEEIVLKAIQDKWYTEFNRLIYSRSYSYLYLITACILFVLFILSLINFTVELNDILNILSATIYIVCAFFTIFDIGIRTYIMVSKTLT